MGELEALALYPRRKGSALFNYRDSCVMSKAVKELLEGLRGGAYRGSELPVRMLPAPAQAGSGPCSIDPASSLKPSERR